jgi:hypothetical protein
VPTPASKQPCGRCWRSAVPGRASSAAGGADTSPLSTPLDAEEGRTGRSLNRARLTRGGIGRAASEDAFRLSTIGSGGDMKVFWSNGLVGSITTLAILLLFWPVIDKAFGNLRRLWRPAKASG